MTSNTPAYDFQVGSLQCTAISDGSFNYPLPAFFSNAPADDLRQALRQKQLPTEHVTSSYACLLVDTGQQRLLVDGGLGKLAAASARFFPDVDNAATVAGTLLQNLRELGIEPAAIQKIIITHAHPDHVGGLLDAEGRPVYPTAEYFVAREEWDFWTSESAPQEAAPGLVEVARSHLQALADRLTFVDDGFEVAPGVRLVATPGHTPGHMALSIASGDQHLLHISDLALHPLHLEHPSWTPVLDVDPRQAAATRRRLLDHAAAQQTMLFTHHFPPFPNLGYVKKEGDAWRWQPLRSGR